MKHERAFPMYPEYKESGVDWLGKVPEHWGLKRLRYLCSITTGGRDTENAEEGGRYPFFVRSQVVERISTFAFDGEGVLTAGDGVGVGKVFHYYTGRFDFHQRVYLLSNFSEIAGRLLYYYLKESFHKVVLQGNAKSTVDSLRMHMFQNFDVCLPPRSEQTRLVDFLDSETAKIDTLIDKQQRLIALLTENRQAVISHAVTKGLDPNVPMKDSGIEWLGQVPENWRVCSLGYVASIQTGSTPDRTKPEYWNGDIPWVKTGEVNYSPINSTEESITDLGLTCSAVKVAPKGTLLMAMYGQGVTRGRVAILAIDAAFNQACSAIAPVRAVSVEYLRYFFITVYYYVRDDGNETSQMNLSSSYIAKIKIVRPPLSEQKQIVAYLDTEVKRCDTLIAKANQSIDLMKERRGALISAAVTGKIDVRQVA